MVFPVETEERVKRKALGVCQDHLRKVIEVSRRIPQIIDSFVQGDKTATRQLFAEIKELQESIAIARRQVSQELAEIGAILINREDYLRFTNLTGEIADFCEGISFRLLHILERDWKVPKELKKGLAMLADAVLETISKLRETVITLNYGPTKTLEKAREVNVAENRVDDLYRELEIKVLNNSLDLPVLLLLRDIIQLLEDAADKAEDASDAARILAFAM